MSQFLYGPHKTKIGFLYGGVSSFIIMQPFAQVYTVGALSTHNELGSPRGKNVSAQGGPNEGCKWSPHLDQVQKPYIQCLYGRNDLYQSMCSEFRYGDGKVLGTQPHLTRGLVSTHCVSNPSPLKGSSNRLFQTHIHTNMHLNIQHGISSQKPSIHLSWHSIITFIQRQRVYRKAIASMEH